MALIRATCSECGDIELRSSDLTVRICVDTETGSYTFRCPICRMTEIKEADDQVIDILLAAGVQLQEWQLPRELFERIPPGEPFTHDDIIDLHELLASPGDEWYAVLLNLMH